MTMTQDKIKSDQRHRPRQPNLDHRGAPTKQPYRPVHYWHTDGSNESFVGNGASFKQRLIHCRLCLSATKTAMTGDLQDTPGPGPCRIIHQVTEADKARDERWNHAVCGWSSRWRIREGGRQDHLSDLAEHPRLRPGDQREYETQDRLKEKHIFVVNCPDCLQAAGQLD